MKGNSPKVSSKDQNRPRNLKQYGHSNNLSAAIGGVGSIGQVGVGMQHQLGVRSIQSQKGINRPQTNNLMMSQQVMGSS